MMNKFVKYRFNLIEILAVVVISLGMASVFVLVPVGLENHKKAMAGNSIADMAELVISHIRAETALKADQDGLNIDDDEFPFYDDLEDEPEFDWEVDKVNPNPLKKSETKGYYFIRQLSGPPADPYVDFAAYVKVYRDENLDNEMFITTKYGEEKHLPSLQNGGKLEGDSANNIVDVENVDMVLPLVIEISYPADVEYDLRTKEYFRFEIFNEMFKLKDL